MEASSIRVAERLRVEVAQRAMSVVRAINVNRIALQKQCAALWNVVHSTLALAVKWSVETAPTAMSVSRVVVMILVRLRLFVSQTKLSAAL